MQYHIEEVGPPKGSTSWEDCLEHMLDRQRKLCTEDNDLGEDETIDFNKKGQDFDESKVTKIKPSVGFCTVG